MEMEAIDELRDEKLTLLNAREAAQYLRVSLFTLSRIEREGRLVPFRTPGGHRRYSLRMLHEYLESSRNSWILRSDVTYHQQGAASSGNSERLQLELAQA